MLTPITSPRLSTSGPPELPGLRAASVWMMLSISRPRARAERPAEGADDAGGHRVLEAVRVADGDRELARPGWRRVAELDARQVRRGDADDGQVRLRVVADERRPGTRGRRPA